MHHLIATVMVYLGSALMVYNIYGFVQYARYVQGLEGWEKKDRSLNIPIVLLVMFLLGYVVVGFLGDPDLIVAGILFGGSIYVFIMYRFLSRITRQIVETERLEADLKAAEKSNQAKTEFLEDMSHEMRTPLNVILGLDALALEEQDLSPKMRDRLLGIRKSANHLLALINQLLDLKKVEDGEPAVEKPQGELLDIASVEYGEKDADTSHGEMQQDEQAETGSSVYSLSDRRILVVDDIAENAEIVADLLELEGASSVLAENGQVAVDLFANSQPGFYDAIIMDLRMPVMNGCDAARAIRNLEHEDAAAIPIIALSANAYAADVQQALDAGMNVHLAKPVDVDVLYSTLDSCMKQRATEMR